MDTASCGAAFGKPELRLKLTNQDHDKNVCRQLKLGFPSENAAVIYSGDHACPAAAYKLMASPTTRPSPLTLLPVSVPHHGPRMSAVFPNASHGWAWAPLQGFPLPSDTSHFLEKEQCLLAANKTANLETLTLHKFLIWGFCLPRFSGSPAHPCLIFHYDFVPKILSFKF